MIDIRKLKELVRLMVAHDLTEVDLRDNEEQVTLRRQGAAGAIAPVFPSVPATTGHAGTALIEPPPMRSAIGPAEPQVEEEEDLLPIESPMVGTFYASANPDSPPFVTIGTAIGPDTVVCLIEAMKIFNEIKAETAGTIVKALVKNGQAVEFGQPLFLVRPG
jgi:acetyl-CoA carboxylase biotin carboxyl carrier protein